jgi:hypothetical protein
LSTLKEILIGIRISSYVLYREQMTVSTLPLDRVHMESTAGGGADLVFRYIGAH